MSHSREIIPRCSGCKACENICPKQCLSIIHERQDYFERIIKSEDCSKCGLCESVCPQKHPPKLHKAIIGFNASSRDYAICKRSSSGGIASSIYRYCLKNELHTVGVSFNEKLRLSYDFLKSAEDIRRFAGSKYAYSDMGNIYHDVHTNLRKGEKLVFIGMPCHVAALLNVVGDGQPDLLTVDITCSAMPMLAHFESHIDFIEKKSGNKIANIRFREKNNEYGFTARGASGAVIYSKDAYTDEYMIAFRREIGYCSACYVCPYATSDRCSDITIMDCSMPDGKKPGIKSYYHASQVVINTTKGMSFWEKLVKEVPINYEPYSVDEMIRVEKRMRHPARNIKGNRFFLQALRFFTFEKVVRMMYPLTPFLRERMDKGE